MKINVKTLETCEESSFVSELTLSMARIGKHPANDDSHPPFVLFGVQQACETAKKKDDTAAKTGIPEWKGRDRFTVALRRNAVAARR